MLRSKRVLAGAGAAVLAAGIAAGAAASAANAGTGTTTVTATTVLHAYADYGFPGASWATDSITRVATVTLGLPVTVTDCGGSATTCYGYTATLEDTGIAYALTGATSPGAQAVPITGAPRAVINGGETVTFDASSDAPDAALVPKTVTGAGVSPTDWLEQFFPAGTTDSAPATPSVADDPLVPASLYRNNWFAALA